MADSALTLSLDADIGSFLTSLKKASTDMSAFFKQWDSKGVKLYASADGLLDARETIRKHVKAAKAEAEKTFVPITVRTEGLAKARAELEALYEVQHDALMTLQSTGQTGDKQYHELLVSIQGVKAELDEFEQAGKDLDAAINPAPIKSALEQISEGFDKEQAALKTALDQNLKATARLSADGKKGTVEWDKQVASLKSAKEAADKYDKALEEVGRQIGDQPKKPFGEVALGAFAVTAVVDQAAQAFNSLAAPSKNLDYVTGQLRTLGTEAAGMSESLKASAIDMSKSLPFAASDIQGVMFDALASGVKGGEEGLKKFADTAAKLAVGGGAEIGEATGLLAGQLNAYGASSAEATKYADTFFNIVNFGVTSVKDLSSTLANVVPTAAAMGTSMDNVGAALALMTQKGVPTAQSTTKLNQLLIELQKPAKDLEPILAAAGVSLESLRNDDLPTSLGKVKAAIDATGGSAIQFFSSSEAAAAFSVLTGDMGAFEQTLKDVAGTAGSAENAFAEMAKTTSVQTDIMKSKMDAFLIKVADFAGPKVQAVAGFAAELAPVATSLGALSTVGINAAQGIGKLSEKISQAGGWSGVFSKMSDGIKGFASSVGSAGKGIMSNLFSWKGAALGVAAGLVALMVGTEEGKAAMQEVQESLGNALGGIVTAIAPVITELVDAFKPLLDGVATLLGDVLGTLMTTVGGLLSSIFNSIGPVLTQLSAALVPVFEAFNSILLPIIETVSELIYGAFSEVGNAIGEITKALAPIFSTLTETLAPIFSELTTTLVPIFKELAGTLGEVFSSVGTILANIVATVAPIISQLAAAFAPVIKIVVELQTLFFKTFIETFGSILSTIAPLIGEIATMLGTFLGDTLTQIAPLIIGLGTAIGDVLKGIASTVGDVLKTLVETVLPIVQSLFQIIVPIFKQIFEAVQPILQTLLGSIGTVLQTLFAALMPVVEVVKTVLGSILTTLGGALQSLFATLAPVIEKLGGVFGQVLGIVGKVLGTILTALTPVFGVLSKVIATVMPVIGNLVSTLSGVLGPVIETVAGILGTLLSILADLLGRVLSALAPLLTTIAELFGKILGVVAKVVDQLFTALGPVLNEIVGVLGELIGALGGTVTELLIALMPAIELIVDLIAKLVEWLADGLQDALVAIMPVIVTVAKVLATVLSKAILIVVKLLSGVLKVVTSVVKAIGGWLVGAVKTAVQWIKGAFASAVKFAADILNFFKGIIDGVVGFIQMLVGWVETAINWFLEFAKGIPIVGDVINWVSGAIETFIGWIKDAIGWLLKLFGFLDDDADQETVTARIQEASSAVLTDAKPKPIPTTATGGGKPAGGGGSGKGDGAKADDPYQAELDRLEDLRKLREKELKDTVKDEAKLQEALLLLDEEYATKRLGVAQDFSDGTATVIKDGKSVIVKAAKDIQDAASKGITDFGLEVTEASKALEDFASNLFDKLQEGIKEAQEQAKKIREIRVTLRAILDVAEVDPTAIIDAVKALRLTISVPVGPMLGGAEEKELRDALAGIGDTFLSGELFAESRGKLSEAFTEIDKERKEQIAEINKLDKLSEAERATARAEVERVARKKQAAALKDFSDAAKKIEADALADRIGQYEKYGTAIKGVLSSITDAVAGETAKQSEEQRKAHEKRVTEYGEEEAMLRKMLQVGQATSADFVRRIDEMAADLMDDDVAAGFWDRFEAAGKAAIDGLKTSLDSLRDDSLADIGTNIDKALIASIAAIGGVDGAMAGATAALDEAGKGSVEALTKIGTSAVVSFAQISLSSKNFLADTGALLQNVASQALDALAPQIISAFVGFLGPFGVPAGLLALSLVKAAINSFGSGGLIDGGAQLIQVNERGKKEYVINGDAVQQYGTGFLDAVNEGRLAISSAGKIVREVGPQLDEASLSRLINLAALTERIDFEALSEPVDIRSIGERPSVIAPRVELATMMEEALSVEIAPDPYSEQTAIATRALVDENRMLREQVKVQTRQQRETNALLNDVRSNTRTSSTSNW